MVWACVRSEQQQKFLEEKMYMLSKLPQRRDKLKEDT